MQKNPYQVLGVSKDADAATIKKAYRKLAKRYHPDTNQGDAQAEVHFKEVNDAYEILGDTAKREAYDNQGAGGNAHSEQANQSGFKQQTSQARYKATGDINKDFEKQFEQFFGYNPKTKEKTATGKGEKNPMDTSDLFGSFFKMGKR